MNLLNEPKAKVKLRPVLTLINDYNSDVNSHNDSLRADMRSQRSQSISGLDIARDQFEIPVIKQIWVISQK